MPLLSATDSESTLTSIIAVLCDSPLCGWVVCLRFLTEIKEDYYYYYYLLRIGPNLIMASALDSMLSSPKVKVKVKIIIIIIIILWPTSTKPQAWKLN